MDLFKNIKSDLHCYIILKYPKEVLKKRIGELITNEHASTNIVKIIKTSCSITADIVSVFINPQQSGRIIVCR